MHAAKIFPSLTGADLGARALVEAVPAISSGPMPAPLGGDPSACQKPASDRPHLSDFSIVTLTAKPAAAIWMVSRMWSGTRAARWERSGDEEAFLALRARDCRMGR